MLILQTSEAKPGMKLAAPVPHPDHPEQTLLRGGYLLEPTVIQRLRDLGVDTIFVDYPGFDDLDRHLAVQLSPARQAVYKQVRDTVIACQKNSRAAVPYDAYYAGTRDLITTLLSQGRHPIFLDQMSRMGTDAVGHATAVAHLSLMLGLKLETYLIEERSRIPCNRAKEVVNIGVAGMLHDMGKYQLPSHLRDYHETNQPPTESELKEWQTHARLGYDTIHDSVEPTAAVAVLHHHQHFDGTGFPATIHNDGSTVRFEGKKIHVFARIIQAADLYDRLAAGGKTKARVPNVVVHHLLRTQHASFVDPVVLKMLQAVAPPFPPGSRVTLSNGISAIVISVEDADPYQPVVQPVAGEDWKIAGEPLPLKGTGVSVAAVSGINVAPFFPPTPRAKAA